MEEGVTETQARHEEISSKINAVMDKCMETLKARNPYLSNNQIAAKHGISNAAFSRIKNHNYSNLDAVFKVTMAAGGNIKDILTIIETVNKNLAETLKKRYEVVSKSNGSFAGTELEALLLDATDFIAYTLSALPGGADEKLLLDCLGRAGISAIKKLCDKGVVCDKNGTFYATGEKITCRSWGHGKHHISTYARFYRPDDLTPGRGYIHSYTLKLNWKGMDELQKVHRDFHEKIAAIKANKELEDRIPAFSIGLTDSLVENVHDYELENDNVTENNDIDNNQGVLQ